MSTPNLFTHARSELAQDAVLAYILEWAAPQYRASHPEMNALGEALLRALFAASAAAVGGPTLNAADTLTEVTVETQVRNIDILVFVNGVFALVIEDKVDAHERPGQIDGYKTQIANRPSTTGAARTVHAVYVKSGNESPHRRPNAGSCGVMMRSELLAILDRFPNVANQVVCEFREHLHRIHTETESFRTLPQKWPTRAIEGFYGAIAEWLAERQSSGELADNPWTQWSYQHNQQGGERVCSWCWINLDGLSCHVWLQLHDADTLQVRMGNHPQAGVTPKVEPHQMYAMLDRLTQAARMEPWSGQLWVRKAGRFGGGGSAAVAELTFAADAANWLPLDRDGLLDWPDAKRRLALAMQFVDSIRLPAEVL